MKNLTNTDLNIIQKYCGYDYAQRYQGILKRNSEPIVTVVNTGMVSSGKSSLFNIFIDSTEQEYFPTGAARTTTTADHYDYKNISFIDTPGIDVKSEDDTVAFRTIMEADIIMMIHNIRTGPINRSEAEWLQKIVQRMNNTEMCKERLIFVCTWKDTREKDEDYQNIIDDVKKSVFGITGIEIPFFDVSAAKYLTGISRGAEVLVNNSGVPALRQYLESYAKKYLTNKYRIDQEELIQLIGQMKEQLRQNKLKKDNKMNEIINRVKGNYKARYNSWQNVFDYFSSKRAQLTSLQDELRRI